MDGILIKTTTTKKKNQLSSGMDTYAIWATNISKMLLTRSIFSPHVQNHLISQMDK